jgi:hypothetical protein
MGRSWPDLEPQVLGALDRNLVRCLQVLSDEWEKELSTSPNKVRNFDRPFSAGVRSRLVPVTCDVVTPFCRDSGGVGHPAAGF